MSIIKKALGSIGVLAMLCFLLYELAGTTIGSRFLLEKIAKETGIVLTYADGNLRDGMTVKDVHITQEDIEVIINQGYVKMGWAALLTRQVHLSKVEVDTLTIVNHTPPNDAPFSYPLLELPVNLWLQDVAIAELIYRQTSKEPWQFSDVRAKRATWQGSRITLQAFSGAIDDTLGVEKLDGHISLAGDYPLSLSAQLSVNDLQKHHVAPLQITAQGSLKRTNGTISSHYNGGKVMGEFVVQGVDDDSPFWADLRYERLSIPYLNDEQIVLSDGRVVADGVVSAIELRINTQLQAKTIPSGRYFGRAMMVPPSEGMSVTHLTAITDNGTLQATGELDWRDEFAMQALIKSSDYELAAALPKAYQDHSVYLPKRLDGSLHFEYDSNREGETLYRFELAQRDGERVSADIRQNHRKNSPWRINGDWQQLTRQLPMGVLDSPSGRVTMQVENKQMRVDVNANISRFASLPKGAYAVSARVVGQDVDVAHAQYEGEAGVLSAQGRVQLATNERPLSYNIKATTPKLLPSVFGISAVQRLSGQTTLIGSVQDQGETTRHHIRFQDADLTAVADDKTVQLMGAGQATLLLSDSQQNIDASVAGQLITTGIRAGLAKNAIELHLTGDTHTLQIDKLTLSGSTGHLSAAGTLDLSQGIRWQGNVRADELAMGAFFDKAGATISGDLMTKGHYQDNTLHQVDATFVGRVASFGQVGQLNLNATSDGNKHTIRHLTYQGQAGVLSATGWVDTKQASADLDATLERFDLGQFIKDYPSDLSGQLAGFIRWQPNRQSLVIRKLNLAGNVNGYEVAAQGLLSGEFRLPKNPNDLFANLTKNRFRIDELSSFGLEDFGEQVGRLENTLLSQKAAYERVIRRLRVDDLSLRFGDNRLVMAGNEKTLHAKVDASNLSQLMPTLRGRVAGVLAMTDGSSRLPSIYGDLSIEDLSMPSLAIRQGSVLAKITDFGVGDSSVVAQAVGVSAFGRHLKQLRLDAKGAKHNHTLGLFVNDGNIQVKAQIQGGLAGERYGGVLSGGELQTTTGRFRQMQPSEVAYQINTKQLAVAAHCWQGTTAQDQGRLCLKDQLRISPTAGKVSVIADRLDAGIFSPLLPKDWHFDAKMNGTINASWQANKPPTVDAVLYADNGVIGQQDQGRDTIMRFERVSLLAKSVVGGLRLRGDIKAGQAGSGYVDLVIDPYRTPKTLSGDMALTHFNLAVLRPFFPALTHLAGELNVAGQLSGSLAQPLFEGDALVTDGRVAAAEVPISLNDITLQAGIKGNRAMLDGRFASGDGVGVLTGELDWQDEVQAKLTLQGERLAVISPPTVTASVSPHLQVVVRPKQKYVDIKGVVAVPSATIRPPQANQQVVGVSDDVVVIDRRMSGDALALLDEVAAWSINADIGVDLGEAVVFRGFGATLPLAGAVHLTQQGQGTLNAHGVVQVSERTKIDAIGQNLDLNYAQIRFNGDPKNPRLSIEAIRELGSQTVGVRVAGRVSGPSITVFNDAGLSDQQAMTALVTGRIDEGSTQISEQGFRSQVTNNLAAAGLSLGLRGTRGLTNDLGQVLGLQSLVVDATGNSDDTQVNITGYISPDLYIRYGVGVFNAESSLSMRYQLTRRIYVQATSAAERIVDVVYRWQF